MATEPQLAYLRRTRPRPSLVGEVQLVVLRALRPRPVAWVRQPIMLGILDAVELGCGADQYGPASWSGVAHGAFAPRVRMGFPQEARAAGVFTSRFNAALSAARYQTPP